MGSSGIRYSLPSRDIIADSVHMVGGAQWYDGIVAVVGCEINIPVALMGISRLDRPGIMLFFSATAPTEIYTLSLHDALPICGHRRSRPGPGSAAGRPGTADR